MPLQAPELLMHVLPSPEHRCASPILFKHPTNGGASGGAGPGPTPPPKAQITSIVSKDSKSKDKGKEEKEKRRVSVARYYSCKKDGMPDYNFSVVTTTLLKRDYTMVHLQ
jgi:hypothetical protein